MGIWDGHWSKRGWVKYCRVVCCSHNFGSFGVGGLKFERKMKLGLQHNSCVSFKRRKIVNHNYLNLRRQPSFPQQS